MKQNTAIPQLEKLMQQEFDQIKDNLIFSADGLYHVFDSYTITPKNKESFEVARPRRDVKTFGSLRVALSWCIADKYRQLALAHSLQNLDQEKQRIYTDIVVRQAVSKRMQDPDQAEFTQLKITMKKNHLSRVEQQLTKCVNLAKYWQIQGFNRDETARIRPTQSTR